MKKAFFIFLLFVCAGDLSAQRRMNRDPFDAANLVEDQSELRDNESPDDKIKKNFFLRAEINKTSCYVGEGIMASFKVYSRLNANSRVVKRPALTGFSVLEMVDAYNNEPEVEKIKGKAYYVHLIRKVQLFPLQSGDFILDPAEVESEIYFLKHRKSVTSRRRFRDLFLNRDYQGLDSTIIKKISLQTPSTEIHVNALPEENLPPDFSGAVGNFSVDLRMNDKNLSKFEPAIVKLLISGTGNFPLVTDPTIMWPQGVVVSAPQVLEDFNKYHYPLSGVKSFQYSLDTREAGTFTIPAVQFSYFDPVSKKYKTAETSAITYTVSGDNKSGKGSGEKIIQNNTEFPIQYVYFAVIVLVIIGVIFFQVYRAKKPD